MMATSIWEWLFLGGPWQLMLGLPVLFCVLGVIVAGFKALFGSDG